MARRRSIRSSADFDRVVTSGARVRTPHLTAHVVRSEADGGRLGLAVRPSRRSAVLRNRARRRLREAFAAAGGAGCPVDVVVRTDEAPAKMDFQELVDEMRKVIEGSCDR